jgi:NAD(P)-dependent dehydrogenase (short-subunit alcohol dehydrogenase family)
MGKLDGKAALVTGAGRGLGRAIAKGLAAQGAAVLVNDFGVTLGGEKETSSPADQVAADIRAAGGKAAVNHGSVAKWSEAEAMVAQAVKEFGKLDILVNVAGILRDRMIFNMTEEEWDAVIDVHLKGTFNCSRFASVHMRERKHGRIINISSAAALGSPGQPNYAAAKAGILGLTFSCANALGKYGITCNAIMPQAATRMTDMVPRDRSGMNIPTSETAAGTPSDPANVAPIIIYLASDEAAEINGQIFGAEGYRLLRYRHIFWDKVVYGNGPWNIDDLFKVMRRTLARDLEKPRLA